MRPHVHMASLSSAPLRRTSALSGTSGGVLQTTVATQFQTMHQLHKSAAFQPSSSGRNRTGSTLDYLLALPSIVCAGLAAWQLDRRQSKIALLNERNTALHGDPVDVFSMEHLPEVNQLVRWEGEYEHDKSMFVGPRARSSMGVTEQGWLLVTPVRSLDGKRAVLVRRGWVPDTWRAQGSWRTDCQSRAASGVGVITRGEAGNSFMPENNAERGEWYTINVAAMAGGCGLPDNTPLIEQVSVEEHAGHPKSAMQLAADRYRGKGGATRSDEYPLPKKRDQFLSFAVMPIDHLNYAATWFGLSVATAFLALRLIRRGF